MDRLGCYGAAAVETPAVDRLAAEGVLFENDFTVAAYTLPSVCSIMTGLLPYRHHERANDTDLDDSFDTLAERLHAAGYRTGAVLGSTVLEADRNLTQGFDEYDDRFPEKMEVYDPAPPSTRCLFIRRHSSAISPTDGRPPDRSGRAGVSRRSGTFRAHRALPPASAEAPRCVRCAAESCYNQVCVPPCLKSVRG